MKTLQFPRKKIRARVRASARSTPPVADPPSANPPARAEVAEIVHVLAFRATAADLAEVRATAIREAADPVRHLEWSRKIAVEVALQFGILGSRDDLAGEAAVKLCELSRRFDPPPGCVGPDAMLNAFRGWAWRYIKTSCQREAERLLNAGTYHERRRVPGQPLIVVESIDIHADDQDEQMPLECLREMDDRPWWERLKAG